MLRGCGSFGDILCCVAVVVVGIYCVVCLWYVWGFNRLCVCGSCGVILCYATVVFVGL